MKPRTQKPEPVAVLRVSEVAKVYDVDSRTVKQWLADGLMAGFKTPGGHWRVTDAKALAIYQAQQDLRGSA